MAERIFIFVLALTILWITVQIGLRVVKMMSGK